MKLTINPVVVAGVAASVPVPVDTRLATTSMAVNLNFGASGTVVQVQYTTSDIWAAGYSAAADTWTNAGSAVTSTGAGVVTVQLVGSTVIVATAIRCNVTTSTGSFSFTVWQASNVSA